MTSDSRPTSDMVHIGIAIEKLGDLELDHVHSGKLT